MFLFSLKQLKILGGNMSKPKDSISTQFVKKQRNCVLKREFLKEKSVSWATYFFIVLGTAGTTD